MTITARSSVLLLLAIWLFILGYLVISLPQTLWNSNITAAFPSAQYGWQQELLKQNRSSRQLSIALRNNDDFPALRQAAQQLQNSTLSGLEWYKPANILQQLQQQYQQHQGLLATPAQLQLLQTQQYQLLAQQAWKRLLAPLPLFNDALIQDPLLLTQQFTEQLTAPSGHLHPVSGWLEGQAEGRPLILLHAELSFDAFERQSAALLLQQLTEQLSLLQQQYPALEIYRSGVLFHAVAAAESAAFEMSFYGSLSVMTILLLLLVTFRSLKPLLLTSLVLLIAISSGLAALLYLFETPHLLSLVFATTLIGIAVDYSFHGMLAAHRGQAFFRAMAPILTLSLCTTLLGYLALLVLPFSILQQVAVFICCGLLAAYLAVRVLFPVLLKQGQLPSSHWIISGCQHIASYTSKISRQQAFILLGLFAALAVGCLFTLSFTDNVRQFSQSPENLLQQEQFVRSHSGQNWDSRFIVVLGTTTEQILQKEQQLQPLLRQWQQQGLLKNWQALSQKVSSQQQQQQTFDALTKAYQAPAIQQYLQQLHSKPVAQHKNWLLPEHLALFEKQHIIKLSEQYTSIIFLQGLQFSTAELQALLNTTTDIYAFDPLHDATQSITQIRSQLSYWLLMALVITALLLCWRLGLLRTSAIMLYLLVAGAGALVLSSVVQKELTVFNLIAALLVLALTLDYAIFFTSALERIKVVQAVLLSALTSCLSFGLLAFSQTPAISAFGLTVFIGVSLATLFSPLMGSIRKQGDHNGTC